MSNGSCELEAAAPMPPPARRLRVGDRDAARRELPLELPISSSLSTCSTWSTDQSTWLGAMSA
jgi:hypothetical protein